MPQTAKPVKAFELVARWTAFGPTRGNGYVRHCTFPEDEGDAPDARFRFVG